MPIARNSKFGYLNRSVDSKLTSPNDSLICENVDLGEGILKFKRFSPNDTPYLSEARMYTFDYVIADGSEQGWLDADDGSVTPVSGTVYRKAKDFSSTRHVEPIGVVDFESLTPSRYWTATLSTINEQINPYGVDVISQIRDDFGGTSPIGANIPSNMSCQAHRSLEDAEIVTLLKVLYHIEHGASDYYVSSYITLSLPTEYNDYNIPYNFPHIDANFYNNGVLTVRNLPKAESLKYINTDKITGSISTTLSTFQPQSDMVVAYSSVDKATSAVLGLNTDLGYHLETDTSNMIYNSFMSSIFDPLEKEGVFYLDRGVTVDNINDTIGETIPNSEVVSASVEGVQVFAKYRYPYSLYTGGDDTCRHVSIFFKLYESDSYTGGDLDITIPTLSLDSNAYFLDKNLYETTDGEENILMVNVQNELSTSITVDQVYENISEAKYVLTTARDTLILDDDDEPIEIESEPTDSVSVIIPASVSAVKLTVQTGDDTGNYDDWERIYVYRYSFEDQLYYRLAEIDQTTATSTDADGNYVVELYDNFRSLQYRVDDDGDLVVNYSLDSESNAYPSQAKYIISYNNKLFIVDKDDDNVLRFSRTGYADYFPTTFLQPFDDSITGLAIFNEILLIGTSGGIYALYGNSEDDFVLKTVSKNYNVMENSMLALDKAVFFASPNRGIYAMNLSEIRNISYELGDLCEDVATAVNCEFIDNRWYALEYSGDSGTKMFVFDTKLGGWQTVSEANYGTLSSDTIIPEADGVSWTSDGTYWSSADSFEDWEIYDSLHSTLGSTHAINLFDGDTTDGDGWMGSKYSLPQYFILHYTGDNRFAIQQVRFHTGADADEMISYEISGSHDGENWVDLDTVLAVGYSDDSWTGWMSFENDTHYEYIKVTARGIQGAMPTEFSVNAMEIKAVEFIQPSTLTWKSADLDFEQPSETKKIIEMAIEYKGNISMEVYCDGRLVATRAFPERDARGWMRRRIANDFGYRFNIKFTTLDSTSEIYDYKILEWRKGKVM